MKRTIALLILLIVISGGVSAQWTSRQNYGGGSRTMAVGFTIGNTAYVGGGILNQVALNDFWAYDAISNIWTKKANLPGGGRLAAVGFSIGNKGYIGTGSNGNVDYDDFWEYNPATDSWTQKPSFPGGIRQEAVGFPINGKGYIGTGQHFVLNPNNSFTVTFQDFWEYNPTNDTWTQKADMPGLPRAYAVGAGTADKGYVGLGGNDDQSDSFIDFYEYNPAGNSWTQKASIPGDGLADAGIVFTGNALYLLGGINFPNFTTANMFRRYDIAADSWGTQANFGGGAIVAPAMVSMGGKIYAGTGYNSALTERKDWWQFSPAPSAVPGTTLSGMVLYPNPSTDIITISLPEIFSGQTVHITITDQLGKLAGDYTFTGMHCKVPMEHLKNGSYFLQATAGSKRSAVYTIVKK